MTTRRPGTDQRGFGLVEILLVLVVVAVAGAVLYRYVGSTARTVEKIQEERPLARSKLAADQATLDSFQGVLRAYFAEHGRWPADRAAVLALLPGPPRFQCVENDFEYDPASGTLRLLITDSARC
jgi:prepilin-type N-terminal cleavage/methylation domain-containing protein